MEETKSLPTPEEVQLEFEFKHRSIANKICRLIEHGRKHFPITESKSQELRSQGKS